ncbi:nucleotidyltransferase [Winogradskyella psychrotolerans]|uniref:nucleotidyltransferase domain-containing protein n=1 Tax=Winogradskyella psychrotolerans TaxID=1344585 RepID=UPI001C079620|nr:nucleotidyltransferase [Winogradskyella psychrotolerans]MBU2922222.1 nucleotidyltransferase [Winogradskyella psychrotolerans]
MAIPERQLKTWSNQGAVQSSAATHKSVENCIKKVSWKDDVNYVTYLQGSYPNYTNIYGNSDVDLVVEFRSIFSKDLSALSATEREQFDSNYSDAKYSLAAFKTSVVEQLKLCYGEKSVKVDNKAIVVSGDGSSRLDCDVLVCNPYRKYKSYSNVNDNYIKGIVFKTEHDIPKKTIINYPKIHLKNGSIKNRSDNTNGNFKPAVRVLKNIKAAMVNNGYITKELAPSYFLECLVYNSNNSNFQKSTFEEITVAIINQFYSDNKDGTMTNYLVQNEQRKLFGSDEQQWSISDATTFVTQIIKFWNEY